MRTLVAMAFLKSILLLLCKHAVYIIQWETVN